MNRVSLKLAPLAATVVALAMSSLAAPAGALPSTSTRNGTKSTATPCKGTDVKPRIHADITRREATLSSLVVRVQARRDPYGLNSGQISTLQAANAALGALDGQIASTCYATLAALRADATKVFVDYRVYWLRAPQTHVIEAADHLAEARTRLGTAEAKLAGLVGSNAAAQTDLAAMRAALASADAQLGTPPTAGSAVAAVVPLPPAVDMTNDTAVLQSAHAALLSARTALAAARADGLMVVGDLRG